MLAKIKGHILEVPVTLAVFLGLRREEVVSLRWQAVDFEKKTVVINHTTVLTRREVTNVDNTKNETSNRTLPLTDQLISFLKEVRRRQLKNQMRLGKDYKKSDYICVRENGERLRPDFISEKWTKFLEENNLRKIRFHDLRHTCASLQINNGCSLKDVQDWLGHADITTTANIYRHISMDRKTKMSEGLSEIVKIGG